MHLFQQHPIPPSTSLQGPLQASRQGAIHQQEQDQGRCVDPQDIPFSVGTLGDHDRSANR
jgi:hypothetical protein